MDSLVAIERSSATERCAFCHDALGDTWDVCGGCHTRLHVDCRAQAFECPTLGCPSSKSAAWTAPGRGGARFRHALARLTAREEPSASSEPLPASGGSTSYRGRALSLLGRSLISPLLLVALASYFVWVFAPLHWVGTIARRRWISDRARARVSDLTERFAFEGVAAPVLALGAVSVTPLALAALAFSHLTIPASGEVAFWLAALAAPVFVLPPALGWFGRES